MTTWVPRCHKAERVKILGGFLLSLFLSSACQTVFQHESDLGLSSSETKERGSIQLGEQLRASLDVKDDAHRRKLARKLIANRRGTEASAFLLTQARTQRSLLSENQLRALVELYLFLPQPDVARLFDELVRDKRLEVRRTAWQIAASYPSASMAERVSKEISRRASSSVSKGESGTGLSPEAALAAKANKLEESYPLIRSALMDEGQPAYARAMVALRPKLAADDLLVYLSAVSSTEYTSDRLSSGLRQCLEVALDHFAIYPPSLHHPNFKQLFYFGTAQDTEVAAKALRVIKQVMMSSGQRDHLAFLLVQLPHSLQQIFLDRLHHDDPAYHAELAMAVSAIEL